MFAYVTSVMWLNYFGVNQMSVCDLYCKQYGPRSDSLGAVWSGSIVLFYMKRFVFGKIENVQQM